MKHVELTVDGLRCAGCVAEVEKALSAVPHVRQANVNLALGEARIEFDSAEPDIAAFVAAIEGCGFEAALLHSASEQRHELFHRQRIELDHWRKRSVIAATLSLVLLAVHLLGENSAISANGELPFATRAMLTLQWVLALVLQCYVGAPYYRGALLRLKHGGTNMDTLIALGTTAAFVAGGVALWRGNHPMAFLDAGMILTFITFGKYLETRSRQRAGDAIARLLQLSPEKAIVLRNGKQVEVEVARIPRGETIVVRPGDRIPLDAEISRGTTEVDQSWLTGEPLPVVRAEGQLVYAGSLNIVASFEATVRQRLGTTALDNIVELVRQAQQSKAAVQQMADRVVAWFVPVVLFIAGFTLVAWVFSGDMNTAISCAIAVLVVACPCALGLATPTAIMVGSGCAAERGILIKRTAALEAAGRITTVALDKTGTITTGRPHVLRLEPAGELAKEDLLITAATAEQLSSHPLAKAIVEHATEQQLSLHRAEHLLVSPGQGISAETEAGTVLVGKESLLAAQGISLPTPSLASSARNHRLHVALAGRYLGSIVLADLVDVESATAIEQLKKRGLEVVIISGDSEANTAAIAQELGVDRHNAEVLPADKQELVSQLQSEGARVAMVGDGINDAPALAAADLGIAIGAGADVAIDSADIVLVQGKLNAVNETLQIAQATLSTIKQNLALALIYNVLLIPAAAGAFATIPAIGFRVPPAAAAAAMAVSSLSVVTNSLLLKWRVSKR